MGGEGWGTGGTLGSGRRFRCWRRRDGAVGTFAHRTHVLMDLPNSAPLDAPEADPAAGSLGLLALGWGSGGASLDAEAAKKAPADAPDVPPAGVSATDLPGVAVTVVSGLPRSGTSMLMQMLVAGGLPPFTDGARVPDASNPRGYFEHERVKALATDAGWVSDADGHVVKVVANLLPKLPAGPRYRVVVLDRDVGHVLRSQTAMLARLGRPAADEGLIRAVFEGHYRAALRWAERTPGAEALVVAHADAIADPAATAGAIADFLDPGLPSPLDRAAMAATVDPMLHRERA